MTESMSGQERRDRIAQRVDDYYEQVEALAARHLDLASAFSQAMAEVADELGEEYAAVFRLRLIVEQVDGGWPNPDLLAELKAFNPTGMENFLERFEANSEQQRAAYAAELDELIASMRADSLPSDTQPDQPQSKGARIRDLARATLRGFETIRF